MMPGEITRTSAIVLAAGLGARMRPGGKMLIEIDGRPLAVHAVDAALASRACPVIVVVGHDATGVREAVAGRGVIIVENRDYRRGLSTSIRAGLAVLPVDTGRAIFLLADMPDVRAAHIDRLIAAAANGGDDAICVPTWRGRRGNPVLWARRYFAELASLDGDVGGRLLLDRYAASVLSVAMDDEAVLIDLDEPADLARFDPRRLGGGWQGGDGDGG